MGYFEKRYHPPGTPPGTLVEHEAVGPEEITIRLFDYTGQGFEEQTLSDAGQCRTWLDRDSTTWLHIQGNASPRTLRELVGIFGLHPLAMEDVLNQGQRSKIEDYDEHLFIVMSMPVIHEGVVYTDQVSIFLGENHIISFHSGEGDPFESLRVRLRRHGSRTRQQQADYLLYSMLDLIIDLGFPLLEYFAEQTEQAEEQLLAPPIRQQTLSDIHHLRRELLLLRRNLWPQRGVINTLLREDSPFIREKTRFYLRDCHDHTVQIMDLIENYRDMATSLIDVYLSSSSHRLNEIMRVLTLIATIFIPLTFITGLYGMNFSNPESPWAMPELHWYYGYPMVLALIVAVVTGMLIYFKRKNWL